MRIGNDTAANWESMPFIGKLGKVAIPSLKPTLRATIQRSYMHNTLWSNDPDCIVVRKNKSKLTLDEVLLQLTIFGLSSGQIMISDDMPIVDKDRLNLLKRILPAYHEPAMPLDLFIHQLPMIYALTTSSCIGTHYLTAIINWNDKPQTFEFHVSDLIPYINRKEITKDQQFILFDYWAEQVIGIYSTDASIKFDQLTAHSCKYISMIPINDNNKNSPVFVSSTLHLLQGTIEINEFNVDSDVIQISISNLTDRSGFLYIYFPFENVILTEPDNSQLIKCLNGAIAKFPVQINGPELIHYQIKYSIS
jgi:hypothetical protein